MSLLEADRWRLCSRCRTLLRGRVVAAVSAAFILKAAVGAAVERVAAVGAAVERVAGVGAALGFEPSLRSA